MFMVQFDVTSLYPSIPVKEAINCLKHELIELKVKQIKINLFMSIAQMGMEQSYFRLMNIFLN